MVEDGVETNSVKGLIGSVGKSLALDRHRDEHMERLEGLDSAAEFRQFLEDVPLGMAEPAKRDFIDAVTADDKEWRDWASQLAYSLDLQRAEFRDSNA